MNLEQVKQLQQRLNNLFLGTKYKHITCGFVPYKDNETEGKIGIYMRKTDKRQDILSWDSDDHNLSLKLAGCTLIMTEEGIAIRTGDIELVEKVIIMLST